LPICGGTLQRTRFAPAMIAELEPFVYCETGMFRWECGVRECEVRAGGTDPHCGRRVVEFRVPQSARC
jgi:hypothetical protein